MLGSVLLAAFVVTQVCYFLVNCGLVTLFVQRTAAEVDDATLDRAVEACIDTPQRPPARVRPDGGRPTSGPHQPEGAIESDGTIEPDGAIERGSRETRFAEGPVPVAAHATATRLPPSLHRTIHVLVPIYRERWDTLRETLENVAAQRYPIDRVTVYVIYESADETAHGLLAEIATERDDGLAVMPVEVDRDALAADRSPGEWTFSGAGVPRAKAAALTYAFTTLSFAPDDVVTVFDSDTQVPPDTFELAVAGLREYDIVQAKQTARNVDDGTLPLLESMGIAAWSDLVYAKTTAGPYQLLGKGYFTDARVLDALDRWQLDAVTEDMALGVAAQRNGYSLGVIDRFVQDLCPAELDVWVRQKRRWVRGPYQHLLTPGWTRLERLRFWTGTVLSQLLSLTNVVGVPAGILVALLVVSGVGTVTIPSILVPVLLFNAAVWGYYSFRSYRVAREAVQISSRRSWVRYATLSNPLTQTLYATLWAVPISLAIADTLRGVAPSFVATPNE